jgi:zinc/manganese transport system permease protein
VLEIIAAPFAACLIITGIHTYLGIHVLVREVIFVDLALAQIAAMGVAVALIAGLPSGSMEAYLVSLAFTFGGAAMFAVLRFGDRWIPQEAFIGIVYAVGSALTVLLLSQSAVEREEIEHMLVGRLLFVDWLEVGITLAIYAAVALLYVVLGSRFFEISAAHAAGRAGATRLLDFVFYASFGVVVTTSVKMAGVLLVFSFLIVPARCSSFQALAAVCWRVVCSGRSRAGRASRPARSGICPPEHRWSPRWEPSSCSAEQRPSPCAGSRGDEVGSGQLRKWGRNTMNRAHEVGDHPVGPAERPTRDELADG